ncbi:excalibur calcium-binding domain-containing protein [Streptomyces sp. NPDC001833]|uniref:excalibur calcium-binding domain-containing protein n=1 Tax=Streptomyces sp. NPDC001833 TaxID=3154658 RepID=UPI00333038A7
MTVTADSGSNSVDTSSSDSGGGSTYYANCSAARAAGAAPLYAGDPGYDSHLDRDADGVACE